MSSYAYCPACSEGLPAPTVREIITNEWNCRHCGVHQEVNEDHQQDVLIELLDRIEALEETSHAPSRSDL